MYLLEEREREEAHSVYLNERPPRRTIIGLYSNWLLASLNESAVGLLLRYPWPCGASNRVLGP